MRQDVIDVCVRYALALDSRDWELLGTVFTADAVGEYGRAQGPCRGFAAIQQLCRSVLEPLSASQHLLGNHRVTLTASGADATCYLQATHVDEQVGGGSTFTVGGRYDDRLVMTDLGWRIAHRTLTTLWTAGNSAVIAPR
jgi:3-phenylpropionate/cinnamic acid dioxygenase small subunit